MEISERNSGQVTILDIRGEIDLYNTPEIEMTSRKLIREKKTRILINLAEAPYIDSSGLAMLLNIQRELQKVSGALKLTGLSPGLQKIFEMTKLVTKLAVFESEESALKSFDA
jgi:anti-sigma B factor antagonist